MKLYRILKLKESGTAIPATETQSPQRKDEDFLTTDEHG
jgi:hypothetical protein